MYFKTWNYDITQVLVIPAEAYKYDSKHVSHNLDITSYLSIIEDLFSEMLKFKFKFYVI
jgi:hypothetical protein